MPHRGRVIGALALLALLLAGCAAQQQELYDYGAEPSRHTSGTYTIDYVVQPGDTLYSIARAYGTSVASMKAVNGIGDLIKPGQSLKIPLSNEIPAEAPVQPEPAPAATPPLPRPARKPEAPQTQVREPAPSRLNWGKPGARFWWPADGRVASTATWKTHGVVLTAPRGNGVVASASGRVVSVVPEGRAPRPFWGTVVIIQHAGGYTTWYAHVDYVCVREHQWVRQGQVIAQVGTTGEATPPCVAFRIFNAKWEPVNPLALLPARGRN